MRPRTRHLGTLAVILSAAGLTAATTLPPIVLHPESRVWVDGTSTVRDYSCRATSLQGNVAANDGAATLALPALEGAVRTVDLTIPVQALECGNGTMNGHLRNALQAKEHPSVRFQLSRYEVQAAGEAEGTVRLTGRLQIAGQEKPVTIDAQVTPEPGGALRVRGKKELLMSEFGVKPPTLMMGTLKVRDRVVVNFDVVLKQS